VAQAVHKGNIRTAAAVSATPGLESENRFGERATVDITLSHRAVYNQHCSIPLSPTTVVFACNPEYFLTIYQVMAWVYLPKFRETRQD